MKSATVQNILLPTEQAVEPTMDRRREFQQRHHARQNSFETKIFSNEERNTYLFVQTIQPKQLRLEIAQFGSPRFSSQ